MAVQGEALPAQHLMELILGRPVRVVCHEDNEATITIVKEGYSPKQRAMMRTFKTNMNLLHELITDTEPPLNYVTGNPTGVVVLQHHEGITHKGDLFTKHLEPVKFNKGLGFINMGEAKLPPPLKKGKVIDFTLKPPPRQAKQGATLHLGEAPRGLALAW